MTALGDVLLFLREVLGVTMTSFKIREEIFHQVLQVIKQSLFTTTFAGFFVGAIMALQFTMQVQIFDALSYLGGLVSSATLREVGPLLIAFLLSGKIGAFTSAELGTMKVTEQIDAIRCLGANPIREIIVPRFVGIVVASFFLLSFGLIFSFAGGILMAMGFSGLHWEEYIRHIPTVMSSYSIISAIVKSFFFSLVISTVCTYRGYKVFGGAREVGEGVVVAATQTMVALVFADWIVSFILEGLFYA